jgi:hypothetical protein
LPSRVRASVIVYRLAPVGESDKQIISAAMNDVVEQGVRAHFEDRPEGPEDPGDHPEDPGDRPEAWPYKKVLLAVLPPTLALFSVLIGVWDNGNRDRSAQAEAEKDRAAAAKEAEAARAAEVVRDQKAAEKENSLREAELVLPKYVDLLEAVHASMSATDRCARAIDANLAGADEWGGGSAVGTAISAEPGGSTKTFIDSDVVEFCSKVEATVDPLELSFDKALLVSDDQLKETADGLTSPLRAAAETAQHLLAAVDTEDNGRLFVTDAVDSDGKRWEEVARVLDDELDKIDVAATALISKVQAVVVQLEP